ncbi:hypothetical protein ACFQ14_03875 [Pseudahrensia aquimaris]|uniref:Hemolysin-type calcium-binding repeat-containing protein n=1 Tax=Pseudahrensia aquimaris TaxID=744461 RepID=A0ABW3FE71_9HYPH
MPINYYTDTSEDTIDAEELKLFNYINAYRVANGQTELALSNALTITASRHTLDTVYNMGVYSGHSWSDAPYVSGDSSTYANMWDAPERIGTGYTGNGYEISTGYSGTSVATATMTAENALANWQGSAPHNDVMLSQGIWASFPFTSIGVAIHKGIAHVWFGQEVDASGGPIIEGVTPTNGSDVLEGDNTANVIDLLDGDDTYRGYNGNDEIFGGAGRDTLFGHNGNDKLNGGTDADTMAGGNGNDSYWVDHTSDKVVEKAGQGYDVIYTDLSSYTLPSNTERLIFTDNGNHTARGNSGDNRFSGNAGKDKFIIDDGGADTFSGGSGQDTFDARSSDTGIRVYLNNQDANAGATAGDFFASIETFIGSSSAADIMRAGDGRARFSGSDGNDRLYGGNNTDYLRGDGGDDDLRGGNGRDTIHGGTGDDDLRGGNDRDQFRFVDSDFGQDVIFDYQEGLDYLRFYSAVADSFSDFTISNNNSATVRVTLKSDTSNHIDINSHDGSALTIDAGDFLFY